MVEMNKFSINFFFRSKSFNLRLWQILQHHFDRKKSDSQTRNDRNKNNNSDVFDDSDYDDENDHRDVIRT